MLLADSVRVAFGFEVLGLRDAAYSLPKQTKPPDCERDVDERRSDTSRRRRSISGVTLSRPSLSHPARGRAECRRISQRPIAEKTQLRLSSSAWETSTRTLAW